MTKLLFCEKCGHVSSTNVTKENKLCIACSQGNYLNANKDFDKESDTIEDEYRRTHNGDYPAWYDGAEMLREKFFYGKIDQHICTEAVEKRKRFERPDLYVSQKTEEANRHWRAQERDKRENSFGPKCPSCGSTNLSKITATRKILKVGLFGRLGTGDLGKTYQCNDCGIKF